MKRWLIVSIVSMVFVAVTLFGDSSVHGAAPMVVSTQWLLNGKEVLMVGIQNDGDVLKYAYTNSDFSNLVFIGGNASISTNDNNVYTLQIGEH
jgi:hypothetical protein